MVSKIYILKSSDCLKLKGESYRQERKKRELKFPATPFGCFLAIKIILPSLPEQNCQYGNVELTFESSDEILSVINQVKAIEQYFPVVRFIMLYKVVLTLESLDEILKCDQSNESY